MILVRGGVVGKDVSMNYKMGEPFGEALSFGVLRKMTRVSGMMRAYKPQLKVNILIYYALDIFLILSRLFLRFFQRSTFPFQTFEDQ